jgi:leader peptidase (prepilin peptidase) / N-methyltransferase
VTDEQSIETREPVRKAGLAEASLIGVAGVGAIAASLVVTPGWGGVAGAGLAFLALTIAVVDRRCFIIPDPLNALAFLVGTLALGLKSETSEAIANAFARAAVMFGVFFAFRVGYRKLRGREGMGLGDVKLAAVAGVWLTWTDLPIAVDIAALSALASAMLGRVAGKEWSLTEKLPFGFFFAPTIWICWLLASWRGD